MRFKETLTNIEKPIFTFFVISDIQLTCGNELLCRAGYNPDNKMMAIISNTQKKATAIKFIQWLVNRTN